MTVSIQAGQEALLHVGSLVTIIVITMTTRATTECILPLITTLCVTIDRGIVSIVAGVLPVAHLKGLVTNIQIILVTPEILTRRLTETWATITTKIEGFHCREARVILARLAGITMK